MGTKQKFVNIKFYFNLENESKGSSKHNLTCVMFSDWFKSSSLDICKKSNLVQI